MHVQAPQRWCPAQKSEKDRLRGPHHNGLKSLKILERAKGFEPSTPTLARLCSTPELHPHPSRPFQTDHGYMPETLRHCNRARDSGVRKTTPTSRLATSPKYRPKSPGDIPSAPQH